MIAISGATRRVMVAKGGTVTYTTTSTTYTSSDTTDGRDVTDAKRLVRIVWTVTIEEPVQEQDEPDAGEIPVVAKPNRRMATVTGLRRPIEKTPQQAASTWG